MTGNYIIIEKVVETMLRKTGSLIILFILAAATAGAVTVTPSLSSQEIYEGQSAVLQFATDSKLKGADQISLPGVKVEYAGSGSSSNISIINGKRTEYSRYNHQFRLTPVGAGRFELGPFTVNTENGPVEVRATVLTVKKAKKSKDFFLKIKTNTEKVYPGQPVVLDVEFGISKQVSNVSLVVPHVDDTVKILIADTGNLSQLALNNWRFPFEVSKNGKFTIYSTKFSYIPQEVGILNFSSSIAQFNGVVGTRKQRNFFNQIEEVEVYDKFVIPAEAKDVLVSQLPVYSGNGRFSGIVGRDFTLKTISSVDECYVGDLVRFDVELTGEYQTALLNRDSFDLSSLNGFFQYEFEPQADLSPGKMRYSIRPLNDKVDKIPPAGIVVFDSDKEKYVRLKSGELKLKVLETKIVSASDVFDNEPDETVVVQNNAEQLEVHADSDALDLSFYTASEIAGMRKSTNSGKIVEIVFIVLTSIFLIFVIFYILFKKIILAHSVNEKNEKKIKRIIKNKNFSDSDIVEVYRILRNDKELSVYYSEGLDLVKFYLFSEDSNITCDKISASLKSAGGRNEK
jgi:hypothetical protein